jgi:hypothetical protein
MIGATPTTRGPAPDGEGPAATAGVAVESKLMLAATHSHAWAILDRRMFPLHERKIGDSESDAAHQSVLARTAQAAHLRCGTPYRAATFTQCAACGPEAGKKQW